MKRSLLSLSALALCFTVTAQNLQKSSENILLLNHTLHVEANNLTSLRYSPDEVVNGKIYRIIQDAQLKLNQQYEGFTTLEYIPKNSYIAGIEVSRINQVHNYLAGHGASTVELKPEYKLSKRLFNGDIPDWAWIDNTEIKVWLRHFPDLQTEDVLYTIAQSQFRVIGSDVANDLIAIAIAPENVMEAASLPYILQVQEMEDPGNPENYRARTSHRVNYLQADFNGAPGYDGSGVVVGHGDDGAIDFHVDFIGRLTVNSPPSQGDHGDHVAGTIFGAGNKDPDGRGMAPGAEIHYQDYPDNLFDADQNYTNLGVRITSSSYSNGCNAGYTNFTRQMDQDAIDNPNMIHVFSAGNSGTSNCGYGAGGGWGNVTGGHKIAKNVIATANLTATDGIAGSSSRGPASDGRVKPDLGAVGTSVFSTTDLPSPNSYALKTGTSMACPGVSGTMATLYQAFRDVHNSDPHGGLMKAIVMNTCDDVGNKGPDFVTGYGRLNARYAAQVIEDGNFIIDSITSSSSPKTFQIPMPASGTVKEVKIMLYWPDVPASTISARALVNDLDLSVTNGSNTYNPWVLDPTPNATALNSLAVRERDSLNNVEQVTITNPATGNITVDVSAFNIPSGDQKFFITYQYIMDEVTVTYPAGGEGIDPTGFEYIRWDAPDGVNSFKLEYSTNGGTSWTTIANAVNASLRHFLWTTIPASYTDQAKIRITRNGISGESPGTFTILGQASNLAVASSCPDSLKLTWNAVPGATGYIIYKLGSMYMDSIDFSTTNSVILNKNNPSISEWYSVAAVYNSGVAKRAIAIQKPTGVVSCLLSEDLKVNALLSPAPIPATGAYTDCFNYNNLPVRVELINQGTDTIFGFDLNLQFNSGTVSQVTITDTIPPSATYQHTFSSTISLVAGINTIDVWADYSLDQNRYNDTLKSEINVLSGTTRSLPFFEDFESYGRCNTGSNCGATLCPLGQGWVNVENGSGDDIDWRVDNGGTPSNNTGPSSDHNPGTSFGNYLYLEASNGCDSSEAILLTPCLFLDSSTTQNAVVEFWYHMYGNAMGTLNVDLLVGDSIVPKIMPTVSGNQGNNWVKATINLSAYMGEKVALRIRGKTGNNFESDIAIDDFSLFDPNITPPVANFALSDSSSCTNTPITFSDLSTGNATSYNWDFGFGATPATATGPGPHVVTYSSAGVKVTSMEANNAGGTDKKFFNLNIDAAPVANYVYSVTLNVAYFQDQSLNSPSSYLWDFGDGNTSTSPSPQNTYTNPGKYEVTLTVTNVCGSNVYKDSVEIKTGVGLNEALLSAVRIFPNPNNGVFSLEIPASLSGKVTVAISEMGGKRILESKSTVSGGEELAFDISDLADGVYLLTIYTEDSCS